MQISRLNIGVLIKLLRILPHISSIRISPFPMDLSKTICPKGTKDFDFVSNNNNITIVCLEQMDELKVNNFVFMNIWHHVEYLEMSFTKDVNIEMIIRIIFKR
jgi:hypothetical protein